MTDDAFTSKQAATYIKNHSVECRKLNDELMDNMDNAIPLANVYHYTNDRGLLGIVEKGEIWLGDVNGLNDPTEIGHIISLAAEVLRGDLIKNRLVAEKIADFLDKFHFSGFYAANTSAFVSSLSHQRDDLDQWRAYADNGRGFAIGFDGHEIRDAFMNWETTKSANGVFNIQYDVVTATRYISQIMEISERYIIAGRILSNDGNTDFEGYVMEIIMELMAVIYSIAAAFKVGDYKNEKEFRLIKYLRIESDEPRVHVRTNPYQLIRYIKFPWKDLCPNSLKRIVVGPSGGSQSEKFANDLKRYFKIEHVEIITSTIPYRA